MKERSLLLLRVSLGFLMVIWGTDKLVHVEHGLQVSKGFYFGLFGSAPLLQGFGVLQLLLGLLVVLGAARRYTYPALLGITGFTLLGVWRSIIDPLALFMKGGNAVFYPSLIIVAAVLVLMAFRSDDRLSLDERGGRAA